MTTKPIGKEQVREALQLLEQYKAGKASLEKRIVDNEQWWKGRHWEQMREKLDSTSPQPSSAWLFNSIINKHAEAMDNYPTVNVLPREQSDTVTAQALTSVLPVVLEQCDYESVYDDTWWYKLKTGTGVKGVFWNPKACGGLGDIEIKRLNLLNLFWEPGITDIQDSKNLFNVNFVDKDVLKSQYPDLELNLDGATLHTSKYLYDDTVPMDTKCAVVDWYYKGQVGGRTVLHYCRFVGDTVLFASENEEAFALRGFYDHGKYPVVFDTLFSEEGTPCGFGYIDVMKDCQKYIDKIDAAVLTNTLANARPRYFIRSDGSVNEEEFADTKNTFIHTDMNLGTDSIRPVDQYQLSGNYLSVLQLKIEEIKETSGNKDFMQGGVMGGVSSGTAITALQNAGNKLNRDMIKSSYRAFTKECELVLELIRQFYTQPRVFRITGQQGTDQFVNFDNSGLLPQSQGEEFGVDLGSRLPVFDLKIVPQRSNPFTKESQNEMVLNLFKLGMFNPELAPQTLAAIDIMDFDGKEQMRKRLTEETRVAGQLRALSEEVVALKQMLSEVGQREASQ